MPSQWCASFHISYHCNPYSCLPPTVTAPFQQLKRQIQATVSPSLNSVLDISQRIVTLSVTSQLLSSTSSSSFILSPCPGWKVKMWVHCQKSQTWIGCFLTSINFLLQLPNLHEGFFFFDKQIIVMDMNYILPVFIPFHLTIACLIVVNYLSVKLQYYNL